MKYKISVMYEYTLLGEYEVSSIPQTGEYVKVPYETRQRRVQKIVHSLGEDQVYIYTGQLTLM